MAINKQQNKTNTSENVAKMEQLDTIDWNAN